MPLPPLDIFILLLLAHLLADFVFQTTHMVLNKHKPAILIMHGLQVFALTALLSGGALLISAAIAVSHIAIDWLKLRFAPTSLRGYLADQAAHLVILAGAAFWIATLDPFWPFLPPEALHVAALLSGLLLASPAGGPAVGLLMQRYKADAAPEGLENAGRMIGLLERALIFLMVLIGEPTGIGFLIAAKSILRFDTVARDQRIGEYVIIGTLASFGWALVAAYATTALLGALGY